MGIIHCNSSLPRSGSELMQALLAQHPDVYASATSPLLEYWDGALSLYGLAEVKSQDEDAMKKAFLNFCREGAKGYYEELTDKPVIVDKSRGWLEYADLLWEVFPDARIVSMVRDVKDIIASLEKIYRANPGHPETRHLPKTAEARAKYWVQPDSVPLGLALQRIKDRQARGKDERILYVHYNELCEHPEDVMNTVFKHLKLEPITIDKNNIVRSVPEDDSHYGIFGKHDLKPKIEKPDNRR